MDLEKAKEYRMTQETFWVSIAALGVSIFLTSFSIGYRAGKKSTFLILRGHESDGLTLKQALDYEISVFQGQKPFKGTPDA